MSNPNPNQTQNQSEQEEFSIVIVPDTQEMTARHPEYLHKLTRWIADNAGDLNLKMVLHLGDVVNDGAKDENQYRIASVAWEQIDKAGIPYFIVPGNHDYDNMLSADRSLATYNRYFGASRYASKPWSPSFYEEGNSANGYVRLEIGGKPYLFMGLEFGPRDEVLAWADQVLEQYREHKAIIFTHCYMYMNGERNKQGCTYNPKDYKGATGANDGEDMWEKCFRKHANVMAVFSGHQICENVSYRTDKSLHGNVILQSFQNWQCADRGGEGRIRILRYHPSSGELSLKVFNTFHEVYESDPGYDVAVSFDAHEGLQFPKP